MIRRYLLPLLGLASVVAVGVVQGFWTDRWQVSGKVAEAVQRLERVPAEIGDWRGEELDLKNEKLDVAGALNRRYVNRKTGDVVMATLVCGRPGRVSIHTPDACYGASGFKVGKMTEYELKTEGEGKPPRLFTADMTKTSGTEQHQQRLFWAWRAASGWQVASDPRARFASQPVLFKLYIARDLTAATPLDQDPCVAFLRELLPALDAALGE